MLRYLSIFGNELRMIYHNVPVQKVGDLENSIGILTQVEVVAIAWKGLLLITYSATTFSDHFFCMEAESKCAK